MKIITAAALAGAALLMAGVPASADDGPIDFGIFQGVDDSKSSWGRADFGTSGTVPKPALSMLVDGLASPDRR